MTEEIKEPSGIPSNRRIFRTSTWREVAAFAIILMEISWAILWYRVLISLDQDISYWRVFIVFGGIFFATYWAARLMNSLDLSMMVRRLLLLGLLLVFIFVGFGAFQQPGGVFNIQDIFDRIVREFRDMDGFIPIEFVIILVVVFVWWRGIAFSSKHIDPESASGGFRTGVYLLFAYGVLFALTKEPSPIALYLFVFFSLIGMSAARISVLGKLRGGQSIPFDRRWLIGLTIIILMMVGIAALGVTFMQGRDFSIIFDIVTWIVFLIVLLISPVLWLINRLFFIFWDWLALEKMLEVAVDLLRRLRSALATIAAAVNDWFQNFEQQDIRDLFTSLAGLKPYVLWGTIIFVVLLFLWTIRRYRTRNESPSEQEVESLLDQEDLLDMLRDAFRKGFGKLTDTMEQLMGLQRVRRLWAAARIRRIYTRLMDLTTKLGHPRSPSQTPLEFLPDMEELFPTLSGDLALITRAYIKVRYGELPELAQDVELVVSAWERVKAEGKIKSKEWR
jgi:hypothetical protein